MAFWLFKSEPFKWSFDEQKACGAAGTEWTGVRNYQARNFMRSMQIGERGFFYHSNEGKAVVGALSRLGRQQFTDVRIGKRFELTVEDEVTEAVLADVRTLADDVLSNSVIEDVVSITVLDAAPAV